MSTQPNNPPRFTVTSLSIPENTQISYQIIAVDDDPQDSIDSYSITGGTDDALFSMSEEGGARCSIPT